MDIKVKHRIVGFAVLIVLAIILVPFILKHANSIDEPKLSSSIPLPPDKASTQLAAADNTNATMQLSDTTNNDVANDSAQGKAVPLAIKPLNVAANPDEQRPNNVENVNASTTAAAPTIQSVMQSATSAQQPATTNYQPTEQPATVTPANESTNAATPADTEQQPAEQSTPKRTKSGKVKTKYADDTATKSHSKHTKHAVATAGNAWTVQLGSFASKTNADKLVKELRAKGFAAYITAQNSNHRVFVGPETQRNKADQMLKKLQAEFKLNGVVVKYKV